jgi:hypothetical protein
VAHPTPYSFVARVVEDTTRTTTGTQNVTYTGIGTVKGVMIIAIRVTAEDTLTQGYSACVGYADDQFRQRCVSVWSEDNAADSDCATQGTRSAVLRLLDPTTGTALVKASLNAFVTDGIQLDFTIADGTAWKFVAVLFAGTRTECFVGDEVPFAVNAGSKTVTTGIAQDFVLCMTMPEVGESTDHDHATFISGVATRDDTDSFCIGMTAHDAESQGRTARTARNDTVGYKVVINGAALSAVVGTAIGNHTSTGFDVTSVGSALNTGYRIAFLAVEAGGAQVESSGAASPTTTGTQGIFDGLGYTSGFVVAASSWNTSQNDTSTQGATTLGVWDGRSQASIALMDQNAADPTNTGMIYRNRIVDLHSHAQVEVLEGACINLTSNTTNGFVIDWTTAPGTARRLVYLSVEDMPQITHPDETVSVSDAAIFVKTALQEDETVSISEGMILFRSATQQAETISIADSVRFVGSALLIANETVTIADDDIQYTGQVLTVGETLTIADAFVAAAVTRSKATTKQQTVGGGAIAGATAGGGAARGKTV